MNRVTAQQKRDVIERAKGYCEYCLSPMAFAPDPFATEHIFPQSRGGETTLNNLALSCQGCNGHKHSKIEAVDPLTAKIVSFYHPRQHQWSDHFAWSDDFMYLVGLSATGRATIEALQVNREGVVNFRQVLLISGQHLPGWTVV